MKRIGLLSDTHNFLDENIFRHFELCDEIWHAGDFGALEIARKLSAFKPLRGVYGNIDGPDIRSIYPESLRWTCEEVGVFMTHIGGSPPKYHP
jgi:predicted phosphodiesterase